MEITERRTEILKWLSFFLLGFLAYSNTFTAPFEFDDVVLVKNQEIFRNGNLWEIFSIWPTRFLAILSFALNYRLAGLDVRLYHAASLLLHILCAVSVWKFLELACSLPAKDAEAPVLPYLGGLIFLLHPVQTQAVTYIFQRSAVLCGLFYVGSVYFYVRQLAAADGRKLPFYLLSLVCGTAAIFSKETAATLPLAIIAADFTFGGNGGNCRRFYPFFLLSAVAAAVMLKFQPPTFTDIPKIVNGAAVSSADYAMTQARVMATYMRLLVLPVNQAFDYYYQPVRSLFDIRFWQGIAAVAAALWAAAFFWNRQRLVSFGVAWFFCAQLIESGFIPLDDLINEHRLYLPMAGFAFFVVGAADWLRKRWGARIWTTVRAGLIAFIVFLGFLSFTRNIIWRDCLTFWTDAVDKAPLKGRPYINRGSVYLGLNRYDYALADAASALALQPDAHEAMRLRVIALMGMGRYKEAAAAGDAVVFSVPDEPGSYCLRGAARFFAGNSAGALADYAKSNALMRNASAYNGIGYIHAARKDYGAALKYYHEALALAPGSAAVNFNASAAYAAIGQKEKAAYYAKKAADAERKTGGLSLVRTNKLGMDVF